MLSEGVNRKLQSTQLRIDEEDNFGLLMATALSEANKRAYLLMYQTRLNLLRGK
jgi:hypothetical protein